jgi:hypothetical protein
MFCVADTQLVSLILKVCFVNLATNVIIVDIMKIL